MRPRGGAPGGRRKRRVVIDTQAARPRPDRPQRDGVKQPPREPQPPPAPPTGPVKVNSGATVKELSAALGVPVPEIIKIMMGAGEMVTITQSLSDEAVQLIAQEVHGPVIAGRLDLHGAILLHRAMGRDVERIADLLRDDDRGDARGADRLGALQSPPGGREKRAGRRALRGGPPSPRFPLPQVESSRDA